jgi:hypothetical protein
MKRLIQALKTNKQPRFILHPYYMLPKLKGPIALHRKLFFLSCKNPARLMLNLYSYLRWVSITAWVLSYRATLKNHSKTEQSKPALFFSLLKLTLGHGIAPRYYFKYMLDQPQNKKQAFTYFYNAELPYFHDYTNQNFPHYKQATQLMGDKHAFALALDKIGLPSVQSTMYKTQDLRMNPSMLYAKKTRFCKPNHASRSCDAFLIMYDAQTALYHIKPITQPDIHDKQAMSTYLNQVFSRHDTLLIQDFIEDHPDLKALSQQEPTTTVRIITEKSDDKPSTLPQLLYLQLELPQEKQEQQFYTILPLTLDSLDVDPVFQSKNKNTPKKPYPIISNALKNELKHAISICLQAHQTLLPIRSASFDVIISNTGPVILEANYNWSIELLYHVIDNQKSTFHPAAHWLKRVASESKTGKILYKKS